VALRPDSEQHDLASPEDYRVDHPSEHPEMWGWHGEWGRAGRGAGWVVAAILLLMITATHYNEMGTLFLSLGAGLIIVMQIWDYFRRKNAWRQ
jgi:hypothetical protein